MIKLDRSNWPIIYVEVDGLTTLSAVEEYNSVMDEFLAFAEDQPEQFGIIYISDMSDDDYKNHKREKAAQKLSNTWLKQNKPRIAENCFGIAMVTQATGMMKMMRPIAKRSMKRMMGAPGDVFFELGEAEQWMQSVLAEGKHV